MLVVKSCSFIKISDLSQGQAWSHLSWKQTTRRWIETRKRDTTWNTYRASPSDPGLHLRPVSEQSSWCSWKGRPSIRDSVEQRIPQRFVLAAKIWLGQWPQMAFIWPCVSMGCIRSEKGQNRFRGRPSPKIKRNISKHAPWPLSSARSSRICPRLSEQWKRPIPSLLYNIRGCKLETIRVLPQTNTWRTALVTRSGRCFAICEYF